MTNGLIRYLAKAFQRYTREPGTRATSARHILAAAITLYAEHTSPAEAALASAETIAQLAISERRKGAL